jgi:Histidine kinase PdtaS, GAF domain
VGADRAPNGFWAAAQIRPTSGPTTLADDVVGDLIAYAPEHLVWTAYHEEIAQISGERLPGRRRWTCTRCR